MAHHAAAYKIPYYTKQYRQMYSRAKAYSHSVTKSPASNHSIIQPQVTSITFRIDAIMMDMVDVSMISRSGNDRAGWLLISIMPG